MLIQNTDDCNKFQYDTNKLNKCCTNGLNLNIDKCFHILFTRNKHYFYSLNQISSKKLDSTYKVKFRHMFKCFIFFFSSIHLRIWINNLEPLPKSPNSNIGANSKPIFMCASL